MSETVVEERTDERLSRGDGDDDDRLDHITCTCSDDMALCGRDITNEEWAETDDLDWCVVCLELDKADGVCPECTKKEVPAGDG